MWLFRLLYSLEVMLDIRFSVACWRDCEERLAVKSRSPRIKPSKITPRSTKHCPPSTEVNKRKSHMQKGLLKIRIILRYEEEVMRNLRFTLHTSG
ncbi:hypothetical protein KP509_24G017800 [Ceratopteris richardii]|uniref:Secreted protein n=1 Tax=Ceratopteris richardii TaxID=49495 RepID=A0A8T2RSX1_CERRI|nr:hypothetical protein KP509_24G017800 [Ceratopteris richardii]